MDTQVASQLFITLVVGLIIGLERDWETRKTPDAEGTAGVRSFGLVSLLGGMSLLLAKTWGWGIWAATFVGLAILLTAAYVLTAQKSEDYGTTTEIALLLTFVLGSLVMAGFPLEAVAAAVVVTWLLELKQDLKHYIRSLQQKELVATLKLLLIAVVILPLLPNESIGPWEAINPRTTGFFVCLVATISYIGYFTVQMLGDRVGLLVTGLLGGIASSTAVTVSLSRLAKQQHSIPLLAAGVALASGIMAPRLLFIIALINSSLAARLALPILLLGLGPLLAAIAIARRLPANASPSKLEMTNPLELKTALKYGLLLMLILVVVRGAEAYFGDAGVYVVAAISGLADVDAVSISLSKAANNTLSLQVASIGVLISIFMNTLVKVFITWSIGGKQLAQWCGAILLGSLGLGFAVIFWIT
ncbi:MAG: MgtC/SapB family protein [Prochlorothrix sp.]